jgi:class 3 adenylate cyclase
MTRNYGWYARLVDRYIDLDTWSTSYKTALLTALILPFQLMASCVGYFGLRRVPGLLHEDLLAGYLAIWFTATALLFCAALVAARRGTEGRWTVYALIFVYGGFTIGLLNLFGVLSSPFLLFCAASPYMVLLFFDVRAGAVAVLFATVLILTSAILAITDLAPYAPVLAARGLDAQLHPAWFAVVSIVGISVFIANFAPVQLAVSARVLQGARLRAAHEDLRRTQQALERGSRLIRRYVPGQLAESILSGAYQEDTLPERRKLTLFFSDVVGFTETADQMEPEDLAALLNEYLSEMVAIAARFGATVNQFVGDGIMAFFGAPESTDDRDHALRCVRMALAMQKRLDELRQKWFAEGIGNPFHVRIGINTGVASVGDFGSQGRMTYTAIGNQTNLTARIQAACEPGKVLVSHSSWGLIKETVPCQAKGEIRVKGIHYPVLIYEVQHAAETEQAAPGRGAA